MKQEGVMAPAGQNTATGRLRSLIRRVVSGSVMTAVEVREAAIAETRAKASLLV